MFCTRCGVKIADQAKFCTVCGSPVQNTESPSKKAVAGKKEQNGFFPLLLGGIKELLKHPKKLIPTFILAAIWLIMPLITGFFNGSNIPLVRFICTLTYANGGILGGFFGTIGGIFGKAVFAAVVNELVLLLCAGKNPFSGFKKGFTDVIGGGTKVIFPFLMGGGIGMLLYFLFNITSAPQNCVIAVIGAVAGIHAIAKKNGLVFSGVFYLARKLSKGKTPSCIVISRIIFGITAGFVIGFSITFLRYPILIFTLGTALLAAGIALYFIGKSGTKKAICTATLMLLFISVRLMTVPAFAAAANTGETSISGKYDMTVINRDGIEDTFTADVLLHDDGTMEISFTPHALVCNEDFSFSIDPNSYSSSEHLVGIYNKKTNTFVGMGDVQSEPLQGDGFTVPTTTYWNLTETELTFDKDTGSASGTMGSSLTGLEASITTQISMTKIEAYPAVTDGEPEHDKVPAFSDGYANETVEDIEDEEAYPSYKGRLTYTNGETNKYGQPFPDLMDFDGDGDADYADRMIQHQLVHNPDYLDTPKGAALVLVTLLSSLLGSGAGAVASAAAGGTGAAMSGINFDLDISGEEASGEKNSNVAIGKYISRDSDGDLNVTDPANGEKRIYIAQGDGTYSNPLTGATYTLETLKESLESREENSELLSQDKATAGAAVSAQRDANAKLSQFARDAAKEKAEEKAREEAEQEHEAYKAKIRFKYGEYDGDDKSVKKKILTERNEEELQKVKDEEFAAYADAGYKTAKTVKQAADVAIDVMAEIDKTGMGKIVKDGYTVAASAAGNAGDVMAGYKTVGGAIGQTIIESGVELVKNHTDDCNLTGTAGILEKFAANVTGDGIKATTDALVKGESLEKAREAGSNAAKQGIVNATVEVGVKYGNKGVAKVAKYRLTNAGETLVSDLTKNSLNGDDD